MQSKDNMSNQHQTIVDIGNRIELLVDKWLVDEDQGLTHELHQPVKREIVLELDRLWEGSCSGYFSIITDQDKVRLYYRGYCTGADSHDEQVACYAESTDGIHFVRPELGLYEFNGSKQNNIIWRGMEAHNFTPFRDSRPDCNPEYAYRAIGGAAPEGVAWNTGTLYAFHSADGIHWSKTQEEPIQTDGSFDTQNVAFWDSRTAEYRSYSRRFSKEGYRIIQSSTSIDFINWATPTDNRYETMPITEHFYTNATMVCPGTDHLYLAFPMRLVEERQKVLSHSYPGVSDTVFLTSRDGVYWDRSFKQAWCRPGLDIRNWTDRNNVVSSGLVETSPEEYSLYITEHFRHDDMRLRRMTLRKHGFASLRAAAEEGEFTTRLLQFTGDYLSLNYSTSATGFICVEVLDEQRQPIAGYTLEDAVPLYGDEIEGVFQWKDRQQLTELIGRAVHFRFVLQDADLFSFQTTHKREG